MARLAVETPPAAFVTLDEVKSALRIRHSRDDSYLQGAIAAATAYLDGPGSICGKLLGPQSLIWTLGAFTSPMVLPIGPVTAVTSITYIDESGVTQTLSPASYYLVRNDDGDTVNLASGAEWPATYTRDDAVTLRFTGGEATLSPRLKAAILLAVSYLNENRGVEQDLQGFDRNPSFAAMIADDRRLV